MRLKEWFKKIDWILLFYIIGFTIGLAVSFNAGYEVTKNILFIYGLISIYIFIFIFREGEINGRHYTKDEILKIIDEAPDVDYVGEYLKERLSEDKQ